MMTLEEAKTFCRIDNDDEDDLIKTLLKTAEDYMISACGNHFNKESEKAKLCQGILVNHWYENRTIMGYRKALPYSIENLLLQLRYDSESSDKNDKNSTIS